MPPPSAVFSLSTPGSPVRLTLALINGGTFPTYHDSFVDFVPMRIEIGVFCLKIPSAMLGGFGQKLAKAELQALCGTRSAGRCVAKTVSGMGHYRAHVRRGPGAVWPRPRPQYNDKMSRSRHQRHLMCIAHTV